LKTLAVLSGIGSNAWTSTKHRAFTRGAIAATSDYFDFQEFNSGDFAGSLPDALGAEALARVLYPDALSHIRM